jgi:hypothetical protein
MSEANTEALCPVCNTPQAGRYPGLPVIRKTPALRLSVGGQRLFPAAVLPLRKLRGNKSSDISFPHGGGKNEKVNRHSGILGGAFLLCSIVACQDNAVPGRESTLSIGQTVTISGEGLKITFLDVISDSRCPSGVTCIMGSEVVCAVRIEEGTQTSIVDFIQSGNTMTIAR